MLLVFVFSGSWLAAAEKDLIQPFNWSGINLPDLPPASGEVKQAGLAGPFVGVHGDALLVAGGANFPDLPPWRGGKKVWWNDVYVLEKEADGKPKPNWFTSPRLELLKPSAYGVAISTEKGLLCIGGCDAERCHDDVFRLQWLPAERELKLQRLPNLPRHWPLWQEQWSTTSFI